MKTIDCKTQAELDAALGANFDIINLVGGGYFSLTAYDSASVTAYGSASVRAYGSASVRAYDSASVTAYGSASVRAYGSASVRASDSASVTAYGSASVRAYGSASVRAYGSASVTAYGSASVRAYGSASVTAYDSASVRAYGSASVTAYGSASVRAYDSASVRAYGSASVTASKWVSVHIHGSDTSVKGGVKIRVPKITTAKQWCDFHGLIPKSGIVVVFKGTEKDYTSTHGTSYEPGTKPSASDWSKVKCCGQGLHFCARPLDTLQYSGGVHFLACPVALKDIVVIDRDKVKAPRVIGKGCVEVDIDGNPLPKKAKKP